MPHPTPAHGSCHCGAVTLTVPHAPEWVNSCNCSLCRRTGALMAYYPDGAVEVTGETRAYVWGDRMIGIHHCPVCGCLTHWRTLGDRGHQEQPPAVPSDAHVSKMGMNARLLDGFDPAAVEVRAVDGASW